MNGWLDCIKQDAQAGISKGMLRILLFETLCSLWINDTTQIEGQRKP